MADSLVKDAKTMVSAPGKVLITGGYLVLERPHSGLVLSTSARFFAIVEPIHPTLATDSWSWSWTDVRVSSPQLFKKTSYKFSLRDYNLKRISPPSDGGNPYVENAIQLAIAAAVDTVSKRAGGEGEKSLQIALLKGLDITILGHNAFYSFRNQIEAAALPLTAETLAAIPEFFVITANDPTVQNPDATSFAPQLARPELAKTGLGSSAAMTTAVSAAVLQYLGVVKLPLHDFSGAIKIGRQDMDMVHAVSQAAHCAAQGKIGSGFDVSAAVYGSQRYIRFSSSILSTKTSRKVLSPLEAVKELMSEVWDGEITEYALPPQFLLIVGEPGYGGSHTPSMVGAVLAWQREDPNVSTIILGALAKANQRVEAGLLRINRSAQLHKEGYLAIIEACSALPAEKWEKVLETNTHGKDIISTLLEIRQAFSEVRSGLRTIGEKAHVPIEPPVQTKLINETISIDGVLLSGVPGAGGYDAIFAIALGQSARGSVERNWSQKGVLSLGISEDPLGVCLEAIDPRINEVGSAIENLALADH